MYPFGISTLILLLITDLCTLLRHCVIIVALSRTLKNHREGEGGRDFVFHILTGILGRVIGEGVLCCLFDYLSRTRYHLIEKDKTKY